MKINELFEARFLKVPEDYKPTLNDASDVAAYINSVSTEDVDEELIMELFGDCKATLRKIPLASLRPGDPDHNIISPKKEKRYSNMDPKFMPPIVVDNGEVIDGNHRYRVALAKGLKYIWAYVITADETFL